MKKGKGSSPAASRHQRQGWHRWRGGECWGWRSTWQRAAWQRLRVMAVFFTTSLVMNDSSWSKSHGWNHTDSSPVLQGKELVRPFREYLSCSTGIMTGTTHREILKYRPTWVIFKSRRSFQNPMSNHRNHPSLSKSPNLKHLYCMVGFAVQGGPPSYNQKNAREPNGQKENVFFAKKSTE